MKLASIQALRAWAAVAVVYHHSWILLTGRLTGRSWLMPPGFQSAGIFGVDVFFVISGFVIARVAASDRPAAQFLRDRALRVLPLFWALSIPWVIMATLQHQLDWRRTVATVTLWPAYDEIKTPYLSVGWTLAYELTFYLAAGLILTFKRRRLGVALLVAVYLAIAGVRFAWPNPTSVFLGSGLTLEFLMGAVLAVAHGSAKCLRPGFGILSIALGTAFWLLSTWATGLHDALGNALAGVGDWERSLLLGTPAAMIVWGALQLEPKRPDGLAARAQCYLGDTSYALYLIHPLVLWACKPFLELMPAGLTLFALIGLSVLAGALVHDTARRVRRISDARIFHPNGSAPPIKA